MKLRYMDRDTTTAIKGIALIFMFIHHFFTFPEFLIDEISYPGMQAFANDFVEPMKLCVPIFAFLTGYFYAFHQNRTLRYSIRKITDLFVAYWFVYWVMLLFALAVGCYKFTLYSFVYEMAALKLPLMVFCWYVLFYGYSMLLLPLLTHESHNALEDILYVLILPAAVASVLGGMYLEGFLNTVVMNIRDWFPCIASGYLCARYNVFQNFLDRGSARLRSTGGKLLLWLSMAVAAAAGRYWWQYWQLGTLEIRGGLFPIKLAADLLFAPLFVYGTANILQLFRKTPVMKILGQIGKYSLHMWFFHCVFFNVCRKVTQPVLYWPHNPVLVVIWGLILCYIPSVLIDKLIVPVNKLKNRFL